MAAKTWRSLPVLETPDGQKIPPLPIEIRTFINCSTVVYGPSGSGKSVVIKSIMEVLNGEVQQIIICSPTEPSNKTYDGVVEPVYIHTTLKLPERYRQERAAERGKRKPPRVNQKLMYLEFIKALWQRQSALTEVYKQTQNIELLLRVYEHLPRRAREHTKELITELHNTRRKALDNIRRHHANPALERELDDKFKEMLAKVLKAEIIQHREDVWETVAGLAESEARTQELFLLRNIGLNPNLLFVMDDSSHILKALGRDPEWIPYFYQNRHVRITTVIGAQDHTDIEKSLRKNAFNSILTTDVVAVSFFEALGMAKAQRAMVEKDIIPTVFTAGHQHRKLVYVRNDPTRQCYYYIELPTPSSFVFGAPATHELARAVLSETVEAGDNPYFEKFRRSTGPAPSS